MNRSAYQIFTFLLCLIWINLNYSQTCNLSIKGKISDLHDNSDLIGAIVKIQGTNFFPKQNLMDNMKLMEFVPVNMFLL